MTSLPDITMMRDTNKYCSAKMKTIRPNPYLRVTGLTLIFLGISLTYWSVPVFGDLLAFVGMLIAFIGVDTKLTEQGVKLGFTNLTGQQIEDVYEEGDSEIVLVARGHRRYRVKRWHYKSSEWNPIREHLNNLTKKQNKPDMATPRKL